MMIARIDAGKAHPHGEETQHESGTSLRGSQPEHHPPASADVRAGKTSSRDGSSLDDPLDEGSEQEPLELGKPCHQLGVLPGAAGGKPGVPEKAEKEGDHRGGDGGLEAGAGLSGCSLGSEPGDDHSADDYEVVGKIEGVKDLVLGETHPARHEKR